MSAISSKLEIGNEVPSLNSLNTSFFPLEKHYGDLLHHFSSSVLHKQDQVQEIRGIEREPKLIKITFMVDKNIVFFLDGNLSVIIGRIIGSGYYCCSYNMTWEGKKFNRRSTLVCTLFALDRMVNVADEQQGSPETNSSEHEEESMTYASHVTKKE